jgi:hypothetical protein
MEILTKMWSAFLTPPGLVTFALVAFVFFGTIGLRERRR